MFCVPFNILTVLTGLAVLMESTPTLDTIQIMNVYECNDKNSFHEVKDGMFHHLTRRQPS